MIQNSTMLENSIIKIIKELSLFNKYGANMNMVLKIALLPHRNSFKLIIFYQSSVYINDIVNSMINNQQLIKISITLDNTDYCFLSINSDYAKPDDNKIKNDYQEKINNMNILLNQYISKLKKLESEIN